MRSAAWSSATVAATPASASAVMGTARLVRRSATVGSAVATTGVLRRATRGHAGEHDGIHPDR